MSRTLYASELMCSDLLHAQPDSGLSQIIAMMQEQHVSSVVVIEDAKPIGIITERDIVSAALHPDESLALLAKDIMSAPVISIREDLDYREAYMQMVQERIRHLVVVNEYGEAKGIISESDFLSYLSPEVLMAVKEISQIMSVKVITCNPDSTVKLVLQTMRKNRISSLVIAERTTPVGIISERDALRLIGLGAHVLDDKVADYMSTPVFSVYESETVLAAQSLMAQKHIRHLVVTDNEGALSGIVTRHDLIKNIPNHYIDMLRDIIDAQRHNIARVQEALDEKMVYQNAMESLPHTLVFATDKEGVVQFVNQKYDSECSIPPVEVGMQCSSFEDPIFELLGDRQVCDAVMSGQSFYKVLRTSSQILSHSCFFHISLSPVLNHDGSFEGYMFIARDISTQKQLEEELRIINAKLSEVYQIAKIGNWEIDVNTHQGYWSDEICEIVGAAYGTTGSFELIERLLGPEQFEAFKHAFEKTLSEGDAYHMLYEIHRLDNGESRWIESRASRTLDASGMPKSLVGTLQDVTEQIHAEQKMQHMNALLNTIRQINQFMIKESKPAKLLHKVCEQIVEVPSFQGAWIIHEHDSQKTLYSSGFDEMSLQKVREALNTNEVPKCCSQADTELVIIDNPPGVCDCPAAYLDVNTLAVTVPLHHESHYYGYLGLSVSDGIIANEHEQEIIKELADDIAFSLFTFEQEAAVAQAKLKAQEADQTTILALEASGHGVWDWRWDVNEVYYSQKFLEMLGHKEEGLDTHIDSLKARIHSNDTQHVESAVKTFLQNPSLKKQSFIFRVAHASGAYLWILATASKISQDANGVATRILGTITDISDERKQFDQMQIQSEAINNASTGINVVSSKGIILYANPLHVSMFGYSKASEIIGTSIISYLDNPHEFKDLVRNFFSKRKHNMEFKARRKDGSTFDAFVQGKKIIGREGEAVYIGSVSDITDAKRSEKRLRQSATVFENTNEGVVITDKEGIIIDINRAFEEITGYQRDETLGRPVSMLKSGRHDKTFYQQMWIKINHEGSWLGEIWNRRKNGEIYPQWLNITRVANADGDIENFIAVFSDISELKESEEKVDFLFYHDHLTELPNRVLLKARLEHTLSVGRRHNTLTAVIFIDLDNFKHINEVYGHSMGDRVLVEVSKQLSKMLREDDTIARIGGDEFVIVINNFSASKEIDDRVQEILKSFNEPYMIVGKEFWITSSIGVSVSPDDGESAEVLVKNADTAMYEAKSDGKNTYKFYNDKMTANSFERVVFESALKNAVQNGEFELYYQPQYSLKTDKLIGMEALVRWRHPTLGIITPDRFIPIAEETKLIVSIGEFVLEQACRDIALWHKEGLCDGRIAVNVSGVQLEHSEFAETIKSALSTHGIDPSMIEIEVTESIVMKDPERWIRILEEIKRIGVAISIDDFGTGYSSLSYLRRLPVDTLKIDRSFIQDLPQKQDACAIADAIISMSKSLGLSVLAEGVETHRQQEYLQMRGCDAYQGFLLSHPMSGDQTMNWLRERYS